jgi:hypothetical protein
VIKVAKKIPAQIFFAAFTPRFLLHPARCRFAPIEIGANNLL